MRRRALVAALSTLVGLVVSAPHATALPDGLALTPPMGFNNWNTTHCRAEFNEAMVKGIADKFVSAGLKDAGYRYVNIDDCWALPQRNSEGNLVPDPARFPNGIKAVADYVHGKGLKSGIYTSAGTMFRLSRVGAPTAPPAGQSFLSDLTELRSSNGWGLRRRRRGRGQRRAERRLGDEVVVCGRRRRGHPETGGHRWRRQHRLRPRRLGERRGRLCVADDTG
jgi:alpha-galactosidase